jgi:hypothetical protein
MSNEQRQVALLKRRATLAGLHELAGPPSANG